MRRFSALALATLLLPSPARADDAASTTRTQAWLEERMSAAVGGRVSFGGFSWSLTGLSAEFTDFRLSVPVEGAPPLTASAASGRLRLSWSGIAGLFGGRVRIAEIVLQRPVFETSAETLAGLARRAERRRPVEVEVERVELFEGRLSYTDRGDGLDVGLSGLTYTGTWDAYRRVLEGPATARGTVIRPPIARALPFRSRGTLRVSARAIEFVQVEASSEGLEARIDGRLLLRGQVSFTADATAKVDLATLGDHLAATFPPLAGSAEAALRIDKGGPGFSVLGRATATQARLGPLAADGASAEFVLRPGLLEIRALDARAYGGRASGKLDVALSDPVRIETEIVGSGLDAERLLLLAGLKLPVAARADGTFAIEGEPGRPATWRGRARVAATPAPGTETRVPARADGDVVFEDGHARIAGMRVELAEARLALELDADLRSKPISARLELEGHTSGAARTQAATLLFMEALEVRPPAVAREPLTGAGAIAAKISVGARPAFDLRLDFDSGAWSGERFDRALFVLRYDGATVAIDRLEATRGSESIAARMAFAASGALDELDARAQGLDATTVLKRVGVAADLTGRLAGEVRVVRRNGVLDGAGRFVLSDATLYGERIQEASGPLAIGAGFARIDPLVLRGPALEAQADVQIALADGTAAGTLGASAVHLAQLALLERAGLSGAGTLRLTGPFRWTGSGPDAQLQVEGRDVVVSKQGSAFARAPVGALRGTLTLTPETARVAIADDGGEAWSARASLGWSPDAPVEATIDLREARVALALASPASAEVGMTAQLRVSGPLARPDELVVDGSLDRVKLRLGSRSLESAAPASLRFAQGRLALGAMVLRDESSQVQGRVAFVPRTGAVEADLSGTLDVAALNMWSPGIRGSGSATFTASVRGDLEEPRLDGRLTVRGARVRLPGFPQPLDAIDVDVRLEGARAVVDAFEAQCGGGALRGTGSATFARGRVASYEATLDVERVSVPYPEGFRGVYDGRLLWSGTPSLGRLGGRLSLMRGLYGEDIELLSLFGSSGREALPDDESVLPRNIVLDVAIVADGNVWMRNNLGRVETRVDLALGGTLARPELTGRLELYEGGTFRFRDVEYRIESGTIELADPRAIRPLLDVRGTTRVRDVEIDLHLEGPVERIRHELTSNPPLSEQDIIGLLLTGRTFEEAVAVGGAAGFTGDIAANYFAGAVTARLGRQLGKVLGLDRLQIDPLLVENGGDPTTRVTVGKQLGPRVGFLYSTTLGATREQSYQLDWDVSRRLQLVTETSTDAGLGGDLRYRTRFGGGPAAARRRATPRPTPSAAVVESVAITGVPPAMAARLLEDLPLRRGAPYSRAALFEGSEMLRHALVKKGRIECRVEARVSEGLSPQVVYEVELGPEVSVTIEGSPWRDRMRQARKLARFWESSLYSPDLYAEGEEILTRDVQLRGYFAADVVHDHGAALDGRRAVAYRVDRGEKVRVRSVRIVGTSGIPEERVRAQMLTRAGGLSFGRRVLDPVVLDEDVRAIRILYRNEGFLGVRIDGPILRLSPKGHEATVTLRIHAGRRWTIGRVEAPTDLPVSAQDLIAWSGLVPGRVFSPAAMLEAEAAIRAKLDRGGHPEAAVEALYTLADDAVNVSLQVTTGPLKRVNAIEIVGNRRTKEKIIRREIGFRPGDPVSREKFLATQQELYRLGIFRSVRLEDAPAAEAASAERIVTIRVEETAPVGFSLGPGYDSESGARLSFALSHDNLGGYDRSVGLLGRWSGREKRLQLVGREPRLFNRRLSGLATFFWEEEEQSGYTIARRSTAVRVESRPDRRWTRFLRYNFQRVDVTPEASFTNEQLGELLRQRLTNVRLGDVGFTIVRDTRDDRFLATRGGYASAEIRIFAKPFVSDETFGKLSLGGSLTRTFPRGSSFSLALRVGAARPMGSTESVPLSERFFAGGESTVRGFRRDSLGPSFAELTGSADLGDVPVGGEALFVINEEWTIPLWRALRGVIFVDAGNVYFELSDFSLASTRESAGVGLRYDTPIGPLRLEYGWKLDRRRSESAGEFHLAIGSVF